MRGSGLKRVDDASWPDSAATVIVVVLVEGLELMAEAQVDDKR